jgi:beta-glucosidase-like glycosyl hydrolase
MLFLQHFYAYSLETSDNFSRHDFDANVSAREISETYMVPFRACVAANVQQVMCSCKHDTFSSRPFASALLLMAVFANDKVSPSDNAVNNVPTCMDGAAQNGVLRGEFGFDGLIVSDCDSIMDAVDPDHPSVGPDPRHPIGGFGGHGYTANATSATALGIRNGCDMDCGSTYLTGIEGAIRASMLNETELDTAITRAFSMRMRLGMFDEHVAYREIESYGPDALDTPASRELVLRAAEESVVLLANKAGLLPLRQPSAKKLRVGTIGPTAYDPYVLMGGKTDYCPSSIVTVLGGLQHASREPGAFITVENCPGCPNGTWSDDPPPPPSSAPTRLSRWPGHLSPPPPSPPPPAETAAFAKSVDVVVLALGGKFGHEGLDWNASMPHDQLELAKVVLAANKNTVVVLVMANPMSIDWLAEHSTTLLHAFEGGQAAGTALANVLLGATSYGPSGVMPWTVYPDNYTASVRMSDMSMRAGPGRTYRFFRGTPTFPFAFGETYTSFELAWAATPPQSQSVATLTAGLQYVVNVTNTGSVAGSKVVAAFVSYANIADGPFKTLFALHKVAALRPGATAIVDVPTDSLPGTCTFCSVDSRGVVAVRGGLFTITIGDGGRGRRSVLLSHTLTAAAAAPVAVAAQK